MNLCAKLALIGLTLASVEAQAARKKKHKHPKPAAAAPRPVPPPPTVLVAPEAPPAPVVVSPAPPPPNPMPVEPAAPPARVVVAPPAPPPGRRGLLLGVTGDFAYLAGGTLSLAYGGSVEAGYHLPYSWLAFSLQPTLLGAHGASKTIQGSMLAVLVPVLVSGFFDLGPGTLRVFAGAFLSWTNVSSRDASGTYQDSVIGLGVQAGASYLFDVWRLKLGPTIEYRFLPYKIANELELSHAIGIELSVLFEM